MKIKEFRNDFIRRAKESLSQILEEHCEEFKISIEFRGKTFVLGHTMYPAPSEEVLGEINKKIEALFSELEKEWLAFFPEGEVILGDPV